MRRFLLLASLILAAAGATAQGAYAQEHCAKGGPAAVESGESTSRSAPVDRVVAPAPVTPVPPALSVESAGHGADPDCCAGSCVSCCVGSASDASAALTVSRPDPDRDQAVLASAFGDRAPRLPGKTIRPDETWDLPPPGPARRLLHSSFLI